MSRLHVQRFQKSELVDCGRLTRVSADRLNEGFADTEYDSAEKIATWLIPSKSRPDIMHTVQVDFCTCEVACSCWALNDFREGSKMPYSRKRASMFLEIAAYEKGYWLAPLITRPAKLLCPHGRAVQRWLKRRPELWAALREMEIELTQRVVTLKPRKQA